MKMRERNLSSEVQNVSKHHNPERQNALWLLQDVPETGDASALIAETTVRTALYIWIAMYLFVSIY